MDIYVLDDEYREIGIIDSAGYSSLIWSERFLGHGDFELELPPNSDFANLLRVGTFLSIKESKRLMVIDKTAEKMVDEGESVVIRHTGPSFEGILPIRAGFALTGGSSKTYLNTLVRDVLFRGELSALDVVPNLYQGTNVVYPISTIDPPVTTLPPDLLGWTDLGEAHDKASDITPLGYRFVQHKGYSGLEWRPTDGYVYISNTDRYEAFPVAAKAPAGHLVAAWSSQTNHFSNGYIKSATSADGGATWVAGPVIDIHATQSRTPNGLASLPRTGSMACLIHHRGPDISSSAKIKFSENGGTSWGSDLTVSFGMDWVFPTDLEWVDTGSGDGLLLAVGYGPDGCKLVGSTNKGVSWSTRSIVFPGPWSTAYNETCLSLLPDGRLMATGRTDPDSGGISSNDHAVNKISVRYSSDLGMTWDSYETHPPIMDSSGMPKTTVMPDGTIVCTIRDKATRRAPESWYLAYLRPGARTWDKIKLNDWWMMYGQVVVTSATTAVLVGARQNREDLSDSDVFAKQLVFDQAPRRIYYDNYTGNDRTKNGEVAIFGQNSQVFNNGEMREVDRDVTVFRNFCANPGFTNAFSIIENQQYKEIGFDGNGMANGNPERAVTLRSVDVDWSSSGKALEIEAGGVENGATSATHARPMWRWTPMANSFDSKPVWGQTWRFRARIEIPEVMTGTSSTPGAEPRRMSISFVKANNTEVQNIAVSNVAPNTVGVHEVSLVVTFPAQSNVDTYNRWFLKLHNGSWDEGVQVRWSDLIITPLNVPYFDGAYSPDSDLMPVWDGPQWQSPSRLMGRSIQGVSETGGGVLVQSTQWTERGVTARLINNTGLQSCWARLDMPRLVKRAAIYRHQKGVLSGAHPTGFGRLDVGPYTGTTGTNAAGTYLQDTTATNGGETVFLHGSFSQLWGSMWWDSLIASPETTIPSPGYVNQVVFSRKYDSFQQREYVDSIERMRNVAYVHNNGSITEVGGDYANTLFARRVVLADGESVTPTNPEFTNIVNDLGQLEIGKHARDILIDGEVPAYAPYVYDKDYYLGDIVLVEDRGGRRIPMRVSEYIFVCDGEGTRGYPTLIVDKTLPTGYWTSPSYSIAWGTADPLGMWDEQP